MITDVDCGLLLQLTGQLVNLSTRQLPYHKVQSSNIKVQSFSKLIHAFLASKRRLIDLQ